MHNSLRHQQGAILVLTLFFVVILLGFSALVLDFGRLYLLRTQMQNAADSAALAAAYELDGKLGARDRAIKAATQLLSHKGPFSSSDEKELLAHLNKYYITNPDNTTESSSTFVFYSWIGSEYDSATPPCGAGGLTDDGKCLANDDEDSQYVRIRLDPLLTTDETDDFGIDFYFAPTLSLFSGSDPITQGTTLVTAVAGNSDSALCDMPPLMICEAAGWFIDENRGKQILLKTQGPGSTWLPGDFAFLEPVQCNESGTDCSAVANLNKALASQLAQERDIGCSPSWVVPLPGDRQVTAYAVNTRLGLYGKVGGVNYTDDDYPASSDIVDYPRDYILDPDSPSFDSTARFGDGNWDRETYFTQYHGSIPSLPGVVTTNTDPIPGDDILPITRFQTYYWEQHGVPGTGTPDDWAEVYHNLWEEEKLDNIGPYPQNVAVKTPTAPEEQCLQRPSNLAWDHPSHSHCLNYDGNPENQQGYPTGNRVEWDKPNRRVWFVSALNCAEYEDEINNRKPFNPLADEGGDFHKFFVTQHVRPGSPTQLIAEYLGPVVQEEEENIVIHNLIQLYE